MKGSCEALNAISDIVPEILQTILQTIEETAAVEDKIT